MSLGEWLDHDGRTQRWLAEKLGVSAPVVNLWIKGKKRPSPEHQEAIAVLSGGAVRPLDWTRLSDLAGDNGQG